MLTQTFVAYISTAQKIHKPASYYFKRSPLWEGVSCQKRDARTTAWGSQLGGEEAMTVQNRM